MSQGSWIKIFLNYHDFSQTNFNPLSLNNKNSEQPQLLDGLVQSVFEETNIFSSYFTKKERKTENQFIVNFYDLSLATKPFKNTMTIVLDTIQCFLQCQYQALRLFGEVISACSAQGANNDECHKNTEANRHRPPIFN